MSMSLETMETDFDRFAEWIGATGDLARRKGRVSQRHNASDAP